MGRLCLAVAAFVIVASGLEAQERQPFHIAQFPDSRTVSLTITSAATSEDIEYDYDVAIGLTEHKTGGEPIFVDNGTHVMRIRCQAPRTVLVGATVYRLYDPPVMGDWKEDLWKALCLQPVS